MRSLGRVAQVSKDLSKLSSNDQLWNRFLSEAIGEFFLFQSRVVKVILEAV